MGMGRRPQHQQADRWVTTADLPQSPGHAFYDKLNALLAEDGFDRHVEDLCRPYYAEGQGRDSIPPGVYFRSKRPLMARLAASGTIGAFFTREEAPPHAEDASP